MRRTFLALTLAALAAGCATIASPSASPSLSPDPAIVSAAQNSVLHPSVLGGPDHYRVEFNAEGMTPTSLAAGIYDAAERIHDTGRPYVSLAFVGNAPIKDAYGNTNPTRVVEIDLLKSTVDGVNFAGIDRGDFINLARISNSVFVNPAWSK